MNTKHTDHYIILKNLLPANYRMLIKNEINVSLSLINKVLEVKLQIIKA